MRLLLLPLLLVACVPQSPPDDDDQAADIAEYDELATKLGKLSTRFLGDEADELQAGGKRIYWLEYEGFDPTIHSSLGGARLNYGFAAGTEGNVRVSDELVVTAQRQGDVVYYRAYDAASASTLRGEITLPAPTDEQRWWAYCADKNDVYIVTTGSATTLHRWTPGGAAPTDVLTLEASGANVGIFLDFMVHQGKMLFIESGRLWTLDLATKKATWVGNKKEISGAVSTNGLGILYVAADGPYYFENAMTRDVRAEIEASSYQLNTTFASAHHYASEGVLFRGTVVYKGQSGMFAYDLRTKEVRPLLLEPRSGTRITYIDPQITDENATLYVTGLESESGAVGADGPVWSLALQ